MAIIPARRGSKGLPRKNTRPLSGKPLISWTVECALASGVFDEVVVTTDDPDVMDIVTQFDEVTMYRRPPNLAKDTVPGIDVVLDVLRNFPGFEFGLLMQPTSPLRSTDDVIEIIRSAQRASALSAVSVTQVQKPPNWMYHLEKQDGTLSKYEACKLVPDRHQQKSLFVLNGALYYFDTEWLLSKGSFIDLGTIGYEMPPERSIDIDTAFDFKLCELMLQASMSS